MGYVCSVVTKALVAAAKGAHTKSTLLFDIDNDDYLQLLLS